MSTQQTEDGPPLLPPPGVVLPLSSELVEENWGNVQRMLSTTEDWSQCFSIADVRRGIADSTMQMWGVRDQAGQTALGLSRIDASSRGQICVFWVIAPQSDDDTVNALVDEAETFARLHECAALEVIAHPWLVSRVPGKVTAVVIERDCRAPRRVN